MKRKNLKIKVTDEFLSLMCPKAFIKVDQHEDDDFKDIPTDKSQEIMLGCFATQHGEYPTTDVELADALPQVFFLTNKEEQANWAWGKMVLKNWEYDYAAFMLEAVLLKVLKDKIKNV